MKRTYTFAKSEGFVKHILPGGEEIEIPVILGILKHPAKEELFDLLKDKDTILKYTHEAIRKASWPVLRQFPLSWIKICLKDMNLPPGRKKALDYLLF